MRDDSLSIGKIAPDLLAWYDKNARTLPWRVSPQDRAAGVAPDPYAVWLSEIMLQQTTVVTVKEYFLKFLRLWPRVEDLAAAKDPDVMAAWAGLGYYARARNLLKCARAVVADHNGQFPADHDALLALPGIGPYTAAAISAIAFDQSETVVDGNVERVISRFCNIQTPLPTSKPEIKEQAAHQTPAMRPGDYAQAMMDLGATLCTPKSPNCLICPIAPDCQARALGTAAELPRKEPKKPKPTRHGIIYLAQRQDGAWLLERRPEKGLLGGMLGWPGSDWGDTPQENPPLEANWDEHPETVRHTFTHFHLVLRVKSAQLPLGTNPIRGEFIPATQFKPSDLPTLMRKAHRLIAR